MCSSFAIYRSIYVSSSAEGGAHRTAPPRHIVMNAPTRKTARSNVPGRRIWPAWAENPVCAVTVPPAAIAVPASTPIQPSHLGYRRPNATVRPRVNIVMPWMSWKKPPSAVE